MFSDRGLDSLRGKSKSPGPSSSSLPLDAVVLSLQDLIFYFCPPEEELEHEEKQTKLRSLRNRQNLFQEEVRHAGKYYIQIQIKCQFSIILFIYILPLHSLHITFKNHTHIITKSALLHRA